MFEVYGWYKEIMPLKHDLSEFPQKDIVHQYIDENKSLSFLSKKFKLSRRVIKNILLSNNIDVRNRIDSHRLSVCKNPSIKISINDIKDLYLSGMSLNDLSIKLNCSVTSLYNILKKNNIVRNNKEAANISHKIKHPHSDKFVKMIQTRIENNKKKYGILHSSQIHLGKELIEKFNNKEWLIKEHIENRKSLSQISKENGVSLTFVQERFHGFGIDIKDSKKSSDEKELIEYIRNFYLDEIDTNNRKVLYPYELDIYLPDKNLAIEYDGLFWHSYIDIESNEEINKHLYKTINCESKGIQLLHIFSNEWETKQDIVKSIISAKLNNYIQTIFARKCIIKELKSSEIRIFLEENHIQGYVPSKINLGLFYKDELVSLMTFSKPRFNKTCQWEIIRFCNKKFTKVLGGASKLFSYFVKTYNPGSIITYADRRYSQGNLYKNLGFNFIRITKPNYFYFKNNTQNIYSRIHFQKHKLSRLLESFDPMLTEADNMFYNGYRRIWDCGNLVFIWNK